MRRLITSKTVTLLVGPKRKAYTAHKDLLCRLIPYFSKAFNGTFTESSAAEIHLLDEDPSTIELFITWLYRGGTVLVPKLDNIPILFNLYIMADKWCSVVLQNSVMTAMMSWFDKSGMEGLQAIRMVVDFVYSSEDSAVDAPVILKSFLVQQGIELGASSAMGSAEFRNICSTNGNFAVAVAHQYCELLMEQDQSVKRRFAVDRTKFLL